MRIENPYHDGERSVQERVGQRAVADRNGQVISSAIPTAALGFIGQQTMVVLASTDRAGQPWASLIFGTPGFMVAESPTRIVLDLSRSWPHEADPIWTNLAQDARVGGLFIELSTRRRLRVNGSATRDGTKLAIAVEEAYPNCPKYIQRRHQPAPPTGRAAPLPVPLRQRTLNLDQQACVAAADTLFVASAHPGRGADASHRGGTPGFVQILDPSRLRVPDYPGNSMYNTLGNFAVHARAGVLIPDFQGQRTLQLVGAVETQWNLDDPGGATGGTGRAWDLIIDEVFELPLPAAVTWEFLDASPFNPL